MVDLSQPVFDNQMLSSHKRVLRPGCRLGAEQSFPECESMLRLRAGPAARRGPGGATRRGPGKLA